VDHLGDEREGGIGAGGSPDGSWWRWPAAVVVEEDPLRFFDDSAIGACFS